MLSSDYPPLCVSTAPGQCKNTGNSELSNMYRFRVEIPEIRSKAKKGEWRRQEEKAAISLPRRERSIPSSAWPRLSSSSLDRPNESATFSLPRDNTPTPPPPPPQFCTSITSIAFNFSSVLQSFQEESENNTKAKF